MRRDTRQRKHAMAGLRAISGQDEMLGALVPVTHLGQAGAGRGDDGAHGGGECHAN